MARWRMLDAVYAATLTLAMAAFCWRVLAPQVGFDDANITQSYALNILGGHGYVYNVGGERVEGSSSLLWTLVNLVPFAVSGTPETLLAAIGAALATVTLVLSVALGRLLSAAVGIESHLLPLMAATLFAAYPIFFAWTVASLMDTALWVMLVTATIVAYAAPVLGEDSRPARPVVVLMLSALLPLSRPEGIAVAIGLAAAAAIAFEIARRRTVLPALAAAVATASFAISTAWRSVYFGQPFPNTAYAKVSLDLGEQAAVGWDYTARYLAEPGTWILLAAAVAGALAAAIVAPPGRRPAIIAVTLMASVVIGGALAGYTLLGGDHFAGFRFFLIVLPVAAPFATLTPILVVRAMQQHVPPGLPRSGFALLAVAAPLAVAPPAWAAFRDGRGLVSGELRIAEVGREIGRRLSALPDGVTVGVIPSGGIRMGYDGPMLDMLGLNWVEMARADHDFTGKLKNHGGFNADVLLAARPDIVHPMLQPCDEAMIRSNPWVNQFLDGLFDRAAFNDDYVFGCWNGLAMFVRRDAVGLLSVPAPS